MRSVIHSVVRIAQDHPTGNCQKGEFNFSPVFLTAMFGHRLNRGKAFCEYHNKAAVV